MFISQQLISARELVCKISKNLSHVCIGTGCLRIKASMKSNNSGIPIETLDERRKGEV